MNLIGSALIKDEYCVHTYEDEAQELPGVGGVTQSMKQVHQDLEFTWNIFNKPSFSLLKGKNCVRVSKSVENDLVTHMRWECKIKSKIHYHLFLLIN